MECTRPESPLAMPLILLAEDDPEMRILMANALRRDGCKVEELGSGQELLDRLRETHVGSVAAPSLIVSDLRMPGLDGMTVLARIRAWGWSVPVILVTAFAFEETLLEASAVGATAVFSKPFDLDDLRVAARYFLSPSRPLPEPKPDREP